ncbi:MAG: permease [Candidatus Omnitrophota bacterium]
MKRKLYHFYKNLKRMLDALNSYVDLFRDSHTFRIAGEMALLFYSILPGLIVGLFLSTWLLAWNPIERIRNWPRSRSLFVVILMAAAGAVSPFCSYLAVPVAAVLVGGGVPPAPVMAFLCATPLMNPTLFAMTWSVFGWPMAAARALSALGFGILGGLLAYRFEERIRKFIQDRPAQALFCHSNHDGGASFAQRWRRAFWHTGWFVVKYVGLGIAIAAIVKEFIPITWVEAAVGRGYGRGVLVGSLLGIPLYACGGGTIPFIQVLMSMGMSPGAALAFFVAGPATKLPTLAAMKVTLGASMTACYVSLSIAWSLLAGMLFQFLIS